MTRFFDTDRSRLLLLQRIALGGVLLPHGLQKVFGWFGGGGIDGTLASFDGLGVPAPLGALVLAAESIPLAIRGGGRFSVDGAHAHRLAATTPSTPAHAAAVAA